LDWEGFGRQRQVAQSYLTTDWVLVLDADEIVTEELKNSLLDAADSHDQNICYQINRYSKAFGKYIRFSGWSPDWIIRFYPRKIANYNDALVHEKVVMEVGAQVAKISKGRLLHDTYDSLHHYIAKTTGYIKAWTDQREGKKKVRFNNCPYTCLGMFYSYVFYKVGLFRWKAWFYPCLAGNAFNFC
jgi:(heptosyl)LPS beta-1,4-glucosyltransferase